MGVDQTVDRYEKAGAAEGGSQGLATGASTGAMVGGAIGTIGGPVGTAIGAGAGALIGGAIGFFTGKSSGAKRGKAEGRRAFLSASRKKVAAKSRAEDKGQLMALKAAKGSRSRVSDQQLLQQSMAPEMQIIGAGGQHDAWQSKTYG